MEADRKRDITVVIATFNGDAFLAEQLGALAVEYRAGDFEVVIADNGSTDQTPRVVSRFDDRLRIRRVDASDQRGQAHARNAGAAAACGRFLLFLDQDDVIQTGYVQSMSAALEDNPFVAARMDVERLNPGSWSRVREIVQTVALPSAPVPWGYGCTLGIASELFDRVGGFDEHLLDAGEDIDLCARVLAAGVPLRYVPNATVSYRFPTTRRDLYRQGRRYGAAHVVLDARQPNLRRTMSSVTWLRRVLGAARLTLLGADRGERGRGSFLLGRRIGQIEGHIRTRTRLSPYARRRG